MEIGGVTVTKILHEGYANITFHREKEGMRTAALAHGMLC